MLIALPFRHAMPPPLRRLLLPLYAFAAAAADYFLPTPQPRFAFATMLTPFSPLFFSTLAFHAILLATPRRFATLRDIIATLSAILLYCRRHYYCHIDAIIFMSAFSPFSRRFRCFAAFDAAAIIFAYADSLLMPSFCFASPPLRCRLFSPCRQRASLRFLLSLFRHASPPFSHFFHYTPFFDICLFRHFMFAALDVFALTPLC